MNVGRVSPRKGDKGGGGSRNCQLEADETQNTTDQPQRTLEFSDINPRKSIYAVTSRLSRTGVSGYWKLNPVDNAGRSLRRVRVNDDEEVTPDVFYEFFFASW
jgi:hypothetical protein